MLLHRLDTHGASPVVLFPFPMSALYQIPHRTERTGDLLSGVLASLSLSVMVKSVFVVVSNCSMLLKLEAPTVQSSADLTRLIGSWFFVNYLRQNMGKLQSLHNHMYAKRHMRNYFLILSKVLSCYF